MSNKIKLEYRFINSDAVLPFKKRSSDAGFDLSSIEDIVINPEEIISVKTGLQMAVERLVALESTVLSSLEPFGRTAVGS